jgi:hypothetical protein
MTTPTDPPLLAGAELAKQVLAIIEDNPRRWRQDAWRRDCILPESSVERHREDPLDAGCGTAFCFAGWVAALDGVRWYPTGTYDWIGAPEKCDCTDVDGLCHDSRHTEVLSDYAAWRLGLDDDDAEALFDSGNGIDDLRRGVDALAAGESVYDAITGGPDWEPDDGA